MIIKNNNTNDIHEVAEKYGWEYFGDCNIEHGGYFYKLEDWNEYDYVEAIEVSIYDGEWNETGFLDITVGSINREADLCSDAALIDVYGQDCVDDTDDITKPNARLHLEIDNCKSNWGVEPSCASETFKLSEDGEYFNANGNWVSIDDLQGWIAANYLN